MFRVSVEPFSVTEDAAEPVCESVSFESSSHGLLPLVVAKLMSVLFSGKLWCL